MALADDLRDAVIEDGRAVFRLAKDTGLQQSGLWRFMHGRTLKIETAEKLAAGLGYEIALVRRPGAKRKRKPRR